MILSIVGQKGFKKTGHFGGLMGVIEKCDTKGFEHLYKIIFSNGASVLASGNDIVTIFEFKSIDIKGDK